MTQARKEMIAFAESRIKGVRTIMKKYRRNDPEYSELYIDALHKWANIKEVLEEGSLPFTPHLLRFFGSVCQQYADAIQGTNRAREKKLFSWYMELRGIGGL